MTASGGFLRRSDLLTRCEIKTGQTPQAQKQSAGGTAEKEKEMSSSGSVRRDVRSFHARKHTSVSWFVKGCEMNTDENMLTVLLELFTDETTTTKTILNQSKMIWPDQLTTLVWLKLVFQQSCDTFTITHFIQHNTYETILRVYFLLNHC